MSKPTPEEISDSIEPNSDQINAVDLVTGPITVTIKAVESGTKEQPVFVLFEDHDRQFRPCKSMRRIMCAAWTSDPDKWLGHKVTLYCDPEVVNKGKRVGGVRISHLSGLDEPMKLMLAESRIKTSEVIIRPIKSAPSGMEGRRNEIKKAWAKYAAEHIKGMSPEEKRQQFAAWLTQTIGEYDTGMLDTDGAQFWTVEQFEKCEEALV